MNEPTDPTDIDPGAPDSANHPGSGGHGFPGAASPAMANEIGGHRTREKRFLLILLGCVAALSMLVGTGLLIAWRAGSIVVQVSGRGRGGDNVRILVPAAAGHLALLCMPDRAFAGPVRNRIFRRREMGTLVRELARMIIGKPRPAGSREAGAVGRLPGVRSPPKAGGLCGRTMALDRTGGGSRWNGMSESTCTRRAVRSAS